MDYYETEVKINSSHPAGLCLPNVTTLLKGVDDVECFKMGSYIFDPECLNQCDLFDAFDAISSGTYSLYQRSFDPSSNDLSFDNVYGTDYYELPRILFIDEAKRTNGTKGCKLFLDAVWDTLKYTGCSFGVFFACDTTGKGDTEKLCKYYESLAGVERVKGKDNLFVVTDPDHGYILSDHKSVVEQATADSR